MTAASRHFREARRRPALCCALVLAGILAQYCPIPVLPGVDFNLSGVCALLALHKFGLGAASAAASLFAVCGQQHLPHHLASVVSVLEVAGIGLLARRKVGLIQADALFWSLAGVPLLFLVYRLGGHLSWGACCFLVLKQVTNALGNAAITRAVITGELLHRSQSQVALRDIVFNMLAAFILLPAVLLFAVASRCYPVGGSSATEQQVTLLLLLLVLLGCTVASELLSGRFKALLDLFSSVTEPLPETWLAGADAPPRRNTWLLEAHVLMHNYQAIAEFHRSLYQQITELNATLEERIAERTSELGLALEAAESASAGMKRILRTVSHEFRTPLGLLTCSVDVLDRYWDRLQPQARLGHHECIRHAALQLTGLVNSVTSFNRTLGAPGQGAEVVDLEALTRGIAGDVAAVWGQAHPFQVTVEECGRGLLDQGLFRRVLENLLTNAFRFTPAGGEVSLRVGREGGLLRVTVADRGIGIPEEELERIFDAFYRCHNVEERRGLGLGLSIVQEALTALGGSIRVHSAVQAGCTMEVEIPLV